MVGGKGGDEGFEMGGSDEEGEEGGKWEVGEDLGEDVVGEVFKWAEELGGGFEGGGRGEAVGSGCRRLGGIVVFGGCLRRCCGRLENGMVDERAQNST